MQELNIFTNVNGFTVLETNGFYLHQQNHRRIQLSNTPKGDGAKSTSSSSLLRYLRHVNDFCDANRVTEFKYMVLLAHIGQTINSRYSDDYAPIIRQIKIESDVFDQFTRDLLTKDLKRELDEHMSIHDILAKLKPVDIPSMDYIDNRRYVTTAKGFGTDLAYGTVGTEAFIVSEKTLRGFSMDFNCFKIPFSTHLNPDEIRKMLSLHYDFSTYIMVNLTVLLEDDRSLLL